MAQNHREVNIGTPEQPIMVPFEAAADPNSKESIQWWNKFALGLVFLSPEVMKALIKFDQEKVEYQRSAVK